MPWREAGTVRRAVAELVAMGPLPDEKHAEVEALRRREELLAAIDRPLTDEEAAALVGLFGPDACYGAAWSIRHLVETAPSWADRVVPARHGERVDSDAAPARPERRPSLRVTRRR